MSFAKPFFDVGLFTNRADALRTFYTEHGLTFDHSLKLGGGVLQHRYAAEQAILKINDARDPLPPGAPGPLAELLIAAPGRQGATPLRDPDGNPVTLLPPGERGVQGLALRLRVSDPPASTRFYTHALGLELLEPGVLSCGQGLLFLEPSGQPAPPARALAEQGLRYLTLQVFDCDTAYAHALAQGATGAREPVTLGSTARIAFVQDPDGIWIELSERASVTGKAV